MRIRASSSARPKRCRSRPRGIGRERPSTTALPDRMKGARYRREPSKKAKQEAARELRRAASAGTVPLLAEFHRRKGNAMATRMFHIRPIQAADLTTPFAGDRVHAARQFDYPTAS